MHGGGERSPRIADGRGCRIEPHERLFFIDNINIIDNDVFVGLVGNGHPLQGFPERPGTTRASNIRSLEYHITGTGILYIVDENIGTQYGVALTFGSTTAAGRVVNGHFNRFFDLTERIDSKFFDDQFG